MIQKILSVGKVIVPNQNLCKNGLKSPGFLVIFIRNSCFSEFFSKFLNFHVFLPKYSNFKFFHDLRFFGNPLMRYSTCQ